MLQFNLYLLNFHQKKIHVKNTKQCLKKYLMNKINLKEIRKINIEFER